MTTYHNMHIRTLWCSGKGLVLSARGPKFQSVVGNFFFFFSSVRSIIIIVGGAWVWLFPTLQCYILRSLLFSVQHCKAGNTALGS